MKKTLDISTRRVVGEVIEANLNYLVRFALLRTGNIYDAEDIVYEAVARLLEADLSKVRRDSLRMYLFRIVYNLCRDFFVAAKDVRVLSDVDNNIPDDAEVVVDCEELERLGRMLDCLPEREAEVVRMNVMDGLSFVEISQILSIPASTAKSRFKSGMDKLKSQYFKKQ